jgi:diguanylate cyclase (GGDEF)-like protein/PAS domain S-box-containing protein
MMPTLPEAEPLPNGREPGQRLTLLTEAQEDAVQQRLRMLEKAFDTTQVGITITDLDGRIVLTNPADARMHGYEPAELLGERAQIFAPDGATRPLDRESITELRSWQREAVNARKDGSTFLARLLSDVVCGEHGDPLGIVTCCEDLTNRRQLERHLLDHTFYHPLTGLPNRALFGTRIRTAMARSEAEGRPFAVLIGDIGRLKLINEALGRSAGDRVLQEVAARLQEVLGPDDLLAHLDGNQFGIQPFELRQEEELEELAARIRAALHAPVSLRDQEIYVTLALGAAIVRGEDTDVDEVLQGAEIALYRAKESDLGLLEVYRARMEEDAARRLELEGQLRRAWARDELRIVYQPIVRLDSRRIVGMEALLRWEHPERGRVGADEFIPVLEEMGLIEEVGSWVLERACHDLRGWEAGRSTARDISLHVNVSSRQFAQGDLPERLCGVMDRTAIDPSRIHLEIVERMVMPGHHTVQDQLERLRRAGMRIGVDDFGTGYSSLGYLHRLPIDTVKIDRSFLRPATDEDPARLVRGIVSLARGLNLEVITEGVEVEAWVDRLREMGCELAQGYLFGRPMEPSDAAACIG